MEQGSQENRRRSMRMAWVMGVLVLLWYLAAIFLVLKP
jgi:hypothetical protein